MYPMRRYGATSSLFVCHFIESRPLALRHTCITRLASLQPTPLKTKRPPIQTILESALQKSQSDGDLGQQHCSFSHASNFTLSHTLSRISFTNDSVNPASENCALCTQRLLHFLGLLNLYQTSFVPKIVLQQAIAVSSFIPSAQAPATPGSSHSILTSISARAHSLLSKENQETACAKT